LADGVGMENMTSRPALSNQRTPTVVVTGFIQLAIDGKTVWQAGRNNYYRPARARVWTVSARTQCACREDSRHTG